MRGPGFGELSFLRMLRTSLDSDQPADLLYFASTLAEAGMDRDPDGGPSFSPEMQQMTQVLLTEPRPETDALLLVWSEMLGDPDLYRAVQATVKPRVQVAPAWLAELARMRPTRALTVRSVLGEEETVLLQVAGPRGGFAALVLLDLLGNPYLEDAYPLTEDIDTLAESFKDMDPPSAQIQPMGLADLRARLKGALRTNAHLYPPVLTDTWPASQPLVEWLIRMLPAAGRGFEDRPAFSQDEVEQLTLRFLAAPIPGSLYPAAKALAPALFSLAINYGTGDPRQWGNLLIERTMRDLVPRKLLYHTEVLAAVPLVLEALVRFTHAELGIDAAVTEDAVGLIRNLAPEYAQLLAGETSASAWLLEEMGFPPADAIQHLFAAATQPGDSRDAGTHPLRPPSLADLGAEVGGEENLEHLDLTPLPGDEPLDITGVPEESLQEVIHVGELIDHAAANYFRDPELGTAARRILARLASTAPELFRGHAKEASTAGAICWVAAKNNRWFDSSDPDRTVKGLTESLGLKSSPHRRANTLLQHLGPVGSLPRAAHPVTLGDPRLLTSTRRREIARDRDSFNEADHF